MSLQSVDVRTHWDLIKPGLQLISMQCHTDWRPEDVYASLINGAAHLYMDSERTETGFVVVRSTQCPFSAKSKLLIWVAYNPDGNRASDTYQHELETLARSTGHSLMEIITPIDEVGDLAQQQGYQKIHSTYRKTIEESL